MGALSELGTYRDDPGRDGFGAPACPTGPRAVVFTENSQSQLFADMPRPVARNAVSIRVYFENA